MVKFLFGDFSEIDFEHQNDENGENDDNDDNEMPAVIQFGISQKSFEFVSFSEGAEDRALRESCKSFENTSHFKR